MTRPLRYLSVCSGIEAATQAWHPLGWQPVAFSEIEPFPCAVLAHHYPHVPNWGDMTKFEEWPDDAIDLLVGGTPCQDFSVAGLGAGLDGARGNLMLTYGAIARRYRPRWLAWENVPGVLSNDGGRAFGSLLGLLSGRRVEVPVGGWKSAGAVEGIGGAYGLAWRVVDAQFARTRRFPWAVPQRRRRVFVVGYLGDWRRAAAVLFDRGCLSGDPAPRREAGQRPAPTIAARTRGGGGLGTDFDCDGGLITSHAPAATLQTTAGDYSRADGFNMVAHALRGEGFDASEDGTGRGTPIVPVAFDCKGTQVQFTTDGSHPTLTKQSPTGGGQPQAVAFDTTQITSPGNFSNPQPGDPCHPLAAGAHPPAVAMAIQAGALRTNPSSGPDGVGVQEGHAYTLEARAEVQAVAFDLRGRDGGAMPEGPHDTANIRAADGGQDQSAHDSWAVRRLTPEECEFLQAMPRGYTRIPYRNKPADACPDGPRYKALGNSMAVNVMEWLGERIAIVDAMEAAA